MRELLSGALPAPQDEPQQRDVIDAAMDWGMRRRRRDWALSGAAALAVLAVGTGVAAMSGGSGNGVSPAGGPRPSSPTAASSPSSPGGTWWTPYCDIAVTVKGDLVQYCKLFKEQQDFNVDFTKGAVKYIQAALPAGFTVKATNTWVLILTGPNGKTNYLFPSTESALTLDGHPLSCGTPAQQACVQTSTAGGTVVVNSWPSGDPSAGYVGAGSKDPRVDILLGTSVTGGMNNMVPPTSATALLTNAQLAKVLTDPGFLGYAKEQLQHLEDISKQLQNMAPPNPSGFSLPSLPTGPNMGGYPVGSPPSGASGSWSSPSGPNPTGSQSSGPGRPSGSQSSPDGNSSSHSSPGNPVSSGS